MKKSSDADATANRLDAGPGSGSDLAWNEALADRFAWVLSPPSSSKRDLTPDEAFAAVQRYGGYRSAAAAIGVSREVLTPRANRYADEHGLPRLPQAEERQAGTYWLAVRLRHEGRGWGQVASIRGYANAHNAMISAKRYARANGLAWPLISSPSVVANDPENK